MALYRYADASGQPAFWRLRMEHPHKGKFIRPLSQDAKGQWQ